MLFKHDPRYRAGGFHICAVKSRESNRAYYAANHERVCKRLRDRYDADPLHRIGKRLSDDARKRRATINRRREELHGEVSPEVT